MYPANSPSTHIMLFIQCLNYPKALYDAFFFKITTTRFFFHRTGITFSKTYFKSFYLSILGKGASQTLPAPTIGVKVPFIYPPNCLIIHVSLFHLIFFFFWLTTPNQHMYLIQNQNKISHFQGTEKNVPIILSFFFRSSAWPHCPLRVGTIYLSSQQPHTHKIISL